MYYKEIIKRLKKHNGKVRISAKGYSKVAYHVPVTKTDVFTMLESGIRLYGEDSASGFTLVDWKDYLLIEPTFGHEN